MAMLFPTPAPRGLPAGRGVTPPMRPFPRRHAIVLHGNRERATKANLPDPTVEVQAAASYTAWQILEAGVRGANSLDDKAIGAFIKTHKIDTIQGKLRFDGPNNYGDDLMDVKQVQNGHWVVVWPKDKAAPGATLQVAN